MNERRLESRFLCADLVRVDWMSSGGEFRTVEAVLEDISPLGSCVQVEERIPLDATISISVNAVHLSGIVSYCVYRDYGYFVGIRFSDETRWSPGIFKPRHLTNLKQLIGSETAVPNGI